jgi:hypothetical protein
MQIQTGTTRRNCAKCHRPFTQIDHYGKRLKGRIDCNVWINPDGTWRKIAQENIEALKGARR